jgi:chromosome segregation ATPase
MNPYVFGSVVGAITLIFVTVLTGILTYNSGRTNRVIEQSEFWEKQIPPLKSEIAAANTRINDLVSHIAEVVATHTRELAEKEAAHRLVLAEQKAAHIKDVAAKDEEIRRWTLRVDRLEQRIAALESCQSPPVSGTISESTTITKPLP